MPIALAALIPVITGAIGRASSAGDRDSAQQAMQNAIQEIQSVNAPPETARAILLQHFQKAGILTPELEHEINAGVSQVAQIKEDPSTRDASIKALEALKQRGTVGLTAEDRVGLNKILGAARKDAEAKRQQIVQNFAQRGVGGSGAELASSLQASQGSANSEADQADQLAGLASQRALQAIQGAGTLGSQIRGQDFDVARTKASAADEMQRFNVNNQIATQTRNVAAKNNVQQYNLNNDQRISDANTTMDNNELYRQNTAKLTDWGNQIQYHQLRSGADKDLANFYQGKAQDTANTWSNAGGAASSALTTGYGQYLKSQPSAPTQASTTPSTQEGVSPSTGGSSYDPNEFNAFQEYLKYKKTHG